MIFVFFIGSIIFISFIVISWIAIVMAFIELKGTFKNIIASYFVVIGISIILSHFFELFSDILALCFYLSIVLGIISFIYLIYLDKNQ
jgi:hypothetical protein